MKIKLLKKIRTLYELVPVVGIDKQGDKRQLLYFRDKVENHYSSKLYYLDKNHIDIILSIINESTPVMKNTSDKRVKLYQTIKKLQLEKKTKKDRKKFLGIKQKYNR